MNTFKEFLNEGKEEAKYIRTKLKKELGLSSKDVSVKTRNGGLSSSVNVSIKTLKALSLKQKITDIGGEKEEYQTDNATGEILAGGNTFIFTSVDYQLEGELGDIVQKEFEKVTKGKYDPEGRDVVLYKTFVIGATSRGEQFVIIKGTQYHTPLSDIKYVGATIVDLISKSKNDSLYTKIK